MGKKEEELPCFDLSTEYLTNGNTTEPLTELTNAVRYASETKGCFLVKLDDSFSKLRHRFLTEALVTLFDLPEDTKKRFHGTENAPFSRYQRPSDVSQYFGLDDADDVHVARDFTSLMWPHHHDNPAFCKDLNDMSTEMLNLTWIVLKMVLKSFEIAEDDKIFEKENTASHFRLMKYKAPQSDDTKTTIGLIPHTDKNFVTILCQNDVQGLEVQSKDDGTWSEVIIPNQSFVVFLGDSLKAWSNGRCHSAKHRVITRKGTVRYSCALFLGPKEDAIVEVSHRFVDEDHPVLYRPFRYLDFLSFYASSNFIDGALELFAGA